MEGNIEIELRQGVMQGDPLSPLIFNLAIEPLLERLQTTSGTKVQGYNLTALAFADDITSLTNTTDEGCKQLQRVSGYVGQLDMCPSINKCAAFEYVPFGKTWYLRKRDLLLTGQDFPMERFTQWLRSSLSRKSHLVCLKTSS